MSYFPFRNTDVGSSPVITATMDGFRNGSKTIKIKPGDNPVTIALQPITPGKSFFSQISTHIHFSAEPIQLLEYTIHPRPRLSQKRQSLLYFSNTAISISPEASSSICDHLKFGFVVFLKHGQ